MTLDRILLIALLAMGIAVIAYLARAESDRRLGEALRKSAGSRDEAYKLLTRINVENAQTDSMIRRGVVALSDGELDELLAPRVRPIQPHEFRVAERRPIEDDQGPRAA